MSPLQLRERDHSGHQASSKSRTSRQRDFNELASSLAIRPTSVQVWAGAIDEFYRLPSASQRHTVRRRGTFPAHERDYEDHEDHGDLRSIKELRS